MAEQPRCAECHRPLSDPESIKRGVGPICWAKLQEERGITVPKGAIPSPAIRRNPEAHLEEPQIAVHQRLDLFLNMNPKEEED